MMKMKVYDLDHDAIVGLLKTLVLKSGNDVELTMDYLTESEGHLTSNVLFLELDEEARNGTLRLEPDQ